MTNTCTPINNKSTIKKSNQDLSTKQVEDYLLEHPKFFHQHLALLEHMNIPHPSGNAVSLISKQLEIFRERHLELESQLTELINIAKDNDTLSNRMHELTLALMETRSIEDVAANLDIVFKECFLTDFSTIRIIQHKVDSPFCQLFVKSNDKNLIHFEKELTTNQASCGKPTLVQARFLFGSQAAEEVESCAIIPMSFSKLDALIAIGSRSKTRFQYNMGNMFLTQMGEIIGTRLITLLHT
ncbi:MAG: DUF484 family protein [Methylococcales bacterium]|nr:DUF484 family protein [Methylococcales bacterium]